MVLNGGLVVRELLAGDLDEILDLEAATFRMPWTREVFEAELAAPGRSYLVADHEEQVVGYGGLMLVERDAHINTLAVRRPAPVPAVGTRLMLALVHIGLAGGAEHLTLEVRASNRRAQDFYRKFGMAPVGVRKHYYRDEDALIMWAHDITGAGYLERLRLIEEALP